MAPTNLTLEDQLEPLAADLANALADAKKATQRADEIKTEIRALLAEAGPGEYAAGPETVKASAPRTVDVKKIADAFPAGAHPYLYTLKPDVKLVRAHLDEEQLEDYLTEAGDLRIGLA